jgi:dihydroorotase
MSARPIAIINARLVDPESGYDGPGALLTTAGKIARVSHKPKLTGLPTGVRVIDAGGDLLCPGLIDLRVKTGEPGSEPKETLKSAARAAAAGGVTSIIVQPDTDPVIDDPAVVDFILRRARDIGLVHVYPAGAATKGCLGQGMAEIGLMREAGCVYVTDADRPIVDSRVMRRLLAYAGALGVLVAHRPADPWLTEGASATEGEFAGRMGLAAEPVAAETIMLERDIALVELTGARLMVDQISAAAPLESLARAKVKGLPVIATCSINHLSFNELDIGDYRTFCKLIPPLRCEDDRLALIDAMASGLVDIVVSAHTPAPPEDKRLPFDEAAAGAIGLETLLPALLTLHHEGRVPLLRLIEAATLAPAKAIGLAAGRLKVGAPADLLLCDIDAPRLIDAEDLISKSKNSAFDGRRLQGRVLMTLVDGRVVYEADTSPKISGRGPPKAGGVSSHASSG